MNLLLVDDQANIISSLLSNINWHGLGVTNTFTATSSFLAKDILSRESIDLMITDIEMPVENGISLLTWVREQEIDLECIFLTSHPDFFYAKQAISLGVVEYVLQPAKDEDIIRAVENAKLRIIKNKKEHNLKLNKLTSNAKNSVLRDFYEKWPINNYTVENQAALSERITQLAEIGFPNDLHQQMIYLRIHILRWTKLPLDPLNLVEKFELLLHSAMSYEDAECTCYLIDNNTICGIIFGTVSDEYISYLKAFQNQCRTEIGFTSEMYICRSTLNNTKNILNLLNEKSEVSKILSKENYLEELTYISENEDDNMIQDVPNLRKYYDQIVTFIQENISLPLTRKDIANQLYLSPDYISNIIKRCTGKSCTEFIANKKMAYAKKMLESTDLPVGEIASAVGYDSFAYFSKVYKDIYHVTPSATRHV